MTHVGFLFSAALGALLVLTQCQTPTPTVKSSLKALPCYLKFLTDYKKAITKVNNHFKDCGDAPTGLLEELHTEVKDFLKTLETISSCLDTKSLLPKFLLCYPVALSSFWPMINSIIKISDKAEQVKSIPLGCKKSFINQLKNLNATYVYGNDCGDDDPEPSTTIQNILSELPSAA